MQMMAERFADVHVMIGPSFAGSLCLISNNTGHPSLTLRCGFTPREARRLMTQRSLRAGRPDGSSLAPRPARRHAAWDGSSMRHTVPRGLALERELGVLGQRPPL